MVTILKSYYKDIFFEFARHKVECPAVIFISGFPSNNNYDDLMNYFYDKGYNVFFPRFSGTFQSNGKFLEKDPAKEIGDFISFLHQGKALNLWDDGVKEFTNSKYIVVTGSFGGTVALGASNFTKIDKIILFSPVWDFCLHNKQYSEQDLSHLTKFVKKGWKNLYRYSFSDIQEQMIKFSSMNSDNYLKNLDSVNILVLHDPTDETTSIKYSETFCSKLQHCKLVNHNLGHGMNMSIVKNCETDILNFIKYD